MTESVLPVEGKHIRNAVKVDGISAKWCAIHWGKISLTGAQNLAQLKIRTKLK